MDLAAYIAVEERLANLQQQIEEDISHARAYRPSSCTPRDYDYQWCRSQDTLHAKLAKLIDVRLNLAERFLNNEFLIGDDPFSQVEAENCLEE